MKFDSPLFDRIRVKPGEDRRVRTSCAICDWPGCAGPATHRAPKGRLREGEYWRFCLDHVREYNQSYNFFAGMSDDAIARYHKEAITGHRPTWKIGVNGAKSDLTGSPQAAGPHPYEPADPFGLFGDFGRAPRWRPVGERLGERRIDHAMSLEAALPPERLRYDIETEMGLSAGSMAGVARMVFGFVNHPQAFGRESFSQPSCDEVGHRHPPPLRGEVTGVNGSDRRATRARSIRGAAGYNRLPQRLAAGRIRSA